MDIRGTEQADVYDQSAAGPTQWYDYYGLAGNDTVRMWMGQVIGGAGNDLIENLSTAGWTGQLFVAYWDAPAGAVVDLAAGTAQDGWGTTDTLIGVDGVNGGGRNDRFYGNAGDNGFSSGGGRDTIDGRDGTDSVVLPWVAGAVLTLADLTLLVSIDGRNATLTSARDANFRLDLIDVELFALDWNQPFLTFADFIDPAAMAQQGLVGQASQRWNAASALGTAVSVSFSFVETAPVSGPGASGFRTFTSTERQAVRDILASVSAVTKISFTEVSEAAGGAGQMRFGASEQAATKGVAYPPSSTPGTAGDVWMDLASLLALSPGTEGYQALLHEIGHALGLRHPRNVDAGDAWVAQWRAVDDTTSMSVMASGASGDGLFRAEFSALDIGALRYLYGSSLRASGNNLYSVGGNDAQAQRSLIDDGGSDTLDASLSPVGVELDLNPAHASSVGVTAQGLSALDNLVLGIDSWIEAAVGSPYDDVITGNRLDNSLTGGLGNDWIDGLAGFDTAVFEGARQDYLLTQSFGYFYLSAVNGTAGFDTLVNVERLVFSDMTLELSGLPNIDFSLDTVAPSAISFSPVDEATGVVVDQNIVLSFSEAIARGTGAILLKTATGTVLASYPAATSSNLTISGSTLTINPSADLAYGSGHQVEFAPGTIKDLAGNAYAGTSSYNFTTTAVGLTRNGTPAPDTLTGTGGNDTLNGLASNDALTGAGGNDVIDGGSGTDTAFFTGTRASHNLSKVGNSIVVADNIANRDGTDTLINTETLRFADMTVDLTMGAQSLTISAANLKTLEEIYVGFFNRVPEAGGMAYWISEIASGVTMNQVADRAYDAGVQYSDLTGYTAGMTTSAYITKIYANVFGRSGATAPNADEIAYWATWLTEPGHTKGNMVLQMLSDVHTHFETSVQWGWVARLLNNKAAVANYYAVEQGLSFLDAATNITFGMQVAALITPTDTTAAIALIGVDEFSTL